MFLVLFSSPLCLIGGPSGSLFHWLLTLCTFEEEIHFMVSLVTEPAKEGSPGPHLKSQGNVRAWLNSLFRLPPHTQTDTPGLLLWLETGRGFTFGREQAHCRDKCPSPRPRPVFLVTTSLPLYSSICQPGRCLSMCPCGFLITNQCVFTKGIFELSQRQLWEMGLTVFGMENEWWPHGQWGGTVVTFQLSGQGFERCDLVPSESTEKRHWT